MFSKRYHDRIRVITGDLVSKTLAQTGISPNALTIISPILTLGALWFLVTGQFLFAGFVIAFTSAFDMLDGALARTTNQVSKFGAFLDSTLDRVSEVLILFGLLLYYQRVSPGGVEIPLIYAAITGSVLISYVRARAEALDYDCKVGLLERPERIVLIVLGLLTNLIGLMLWLLAILTYVTTIQRIWHVYSQSRVQMISRESEGG